MDRTTLLSGAKRVVLKLGTKMITTGPYTLDREAIARQARDIALLRREGKEIVVVTSGAIAAGMGRMEIHRRPKSIPVLQALAAIGQNLLINAYDEAFREQDIPIGQVLFTIDDINDRKRYVNLHNTLTELLERGVVPIINENDTVGTEEVRIGDNDNLSAHVAVMVEADLLVLFTDVAGLYDCDPACGEGAIIPLVERVTPDIRALCGGKGDEASVGGMTTKLDAAQHVMSSGGMMLIAHGRSNLLSELLAGKETGTLFRPTGNGLSARRHWIKLTAKPRGTVAVDAGAVAAIFDKNASLLPSGITGVTGTFEIGDVIAVKGPDGDEIARGVTLYGSGEIAVIKGRHSREIDGILGYDNGPNVIHRNDLVNIRQVDIHRPAR